MIMRIYTGRAQCGKTRRLMEDIAAGAAQGRRQILLAPEMLSHETERRLLETCGNPASRWAEALTFKRAAQRILEQAGLGDQPLLDDGGRVLAMHRAVLRAEKSLTYYQTAGARPEMVERLTALVDELKSCRVTPEQLMQAAPAAGQASGKIRDLGLLYASYIQVTAGLAMDDKDMLTVAEQALDQSDFGEGCDLYFDGYAGFTAQERALVEKLLGRCRSMTFAVLYQQGDSLFFEQEKLIRRLGRMAERQGAPCQIQALPPLPEQRPPALAAVERGLFDYAAPPWQGSPAGVSLCRLDNPEEECEYAASLCRQALASGLRCRQIALAAGDMSLYQPLLENAFEKFQTPLFLAEKSDILQKPVLAAVNGALQAAVQNMSYDAVFGYLKSGLSPLEDDEVDRLENYVLTWNIRGGAYFKPFEKNPAGYDGARAAQGLEDLPGLEAVRQKLIPPLEDLQSRLKGCKEGGGFARALAGFLQQIELESRIEGKIQALEAADRRREAVEYAQLYEILENALAQFAAAMEGEPMDDGEFLRLWRLTLSQYSVASIPVALDNVQAGSFERMSFHRVKLLIVLGARDGALPPAGGGGGLLTEHDRALLLEAGVELTETAEEHAYQAQSQIYRGFAAAESQLTVLYPEKTMEGGASRPSYLLRRIQALLPQAQLETPDPSWRMAAPKPSFELACASVSGEGGQLAETARQLALEHQDLGDYFQRLRVYSAAPRGPIRSKALIAAAYGRKVRMTASRAEKIAACRFSYFMEYGLGAKERKRAQFGAPETGAFIHFVVEQAIQTLTKEPELPPKEAADRAVDLFLQQNAGIFGESARLRSLFRRARQLAQAVVEDVWQELQASLFQPISFEMSFGDGQPNPAVEISSNGLSISLSGKIDRLDGYIQGDTLYVKVADYKTGQKTFHLSDLLYGVNMQMFIYLLMARWGQDAVLEEADRRLGSRADRMEMAGVLYIPARTPFVQGEYDMGEEESKKKLRKELRRIGIVLDEPEVMQALEQPGPGGYRFLPVTLKKDGSVSASQSMTTSGAGFARLTRGVDRQLRRVARQLAQGDIEAQPLTTGPDWSACDWCPYRDACHFDETMKKDRRRKIKALSDEETFAQLQRQEEEEENGR